jgi:hypothetical protein
MAEQIKNDLEEYFHLKMKNRELDVPNIVPDDLFIFIDENNIDKSLCAEIIDLFEKDYRKETGMFGGNFPRTNLSIKDTLEIAFSNLDEEHWINIDRVLFESLNNALQKYLLKLSTVNAQFSPCIVDQAGFQIQKYERNRGKYIWHTDSLIAPNYHRIITFIWYLNDVIEGGETCFLNGKIKPTAGKLVLFPATWTYIHCGNVPVSSNKYIITGWFCSPN